MTAITSFDDWERLSVTESWSRLATSRLRTLSCHPLLTHVLGLLAIGRVASRSAGHGGDLILVDGANVANSSASQSRLAAKGTTINSIGLSGRPDLWVSSPESTTRHQKRLRVVGGVDRSSGSEAGTGQCPRTPGHIHERDRPEVQVGVVTRVIASVRMNPPHDPTVRPDAQEAHTPGYVAESPIFGSPDTPVGA